MDYYSLTCFSQDGQTVYPDAATECQLITSVISHDNFSDQVKIYPNPSNGSFTLGFTRPNDIREIQLADMPGNIVFRNQINNQSNVSINNLPAGTYILTIVDKGSRSTSRKIISCP